MTDHSPLTPRQRDVLSARLAGHSSKETARDLGLADKTVKFHLRAAQKKAGSNREPDMVRTAVREGVLTPDHPLSRAFRGED